MTPKAGPIPGFQQWLRCADRVVLAVTGSSLLHFSLPSPQELDLQGFNNAEDLRPCLQRANSFDGELRFFFKVRGRAGLGFSN